MRANEESAGSGQPIPTGKRGRRDHLRFQLVPVRPHTTATTWTGRLKEKPKAPPLVLDLGTNDAIRVIDADTNELIASDWLAQVTATPAKYRYTDEGNPNYTQPLLIMDVHGLQPLRIGARQMGSGYGGPQFRYGWRGTVGGVKQPAYVVTEADWLALVQKFGLGTRVVDDFASGKTEHATDARRSCFTRSWR